MSPNEDQLFDQFFTLLSDLKHPSEVKDFLSNFMSKTERKMFAKRLAIINLLDQGESYQEIKAKLKVSSATISTLSRLNRKPGIKLALERLKLDDWAQKIVNKFTHFFGKMDN